MYLSIYIFSVLFCAINIFFSFKRIRDILDDNFPVYKLFGFKELLVSCIPILNIIIGVASAITLVVSDEEYEMTMEKITEEYKKKKGEV